MYNYMLETFMTVADYGSFTKASEKLYISPTAVMKQMNTLENHLDLKLIERNKSGVTLTKAGEIIYQDAKFIINYSNKAIKNAKATLKSDDNVFSVGTSLLNPAKPFMDLWYKINNKFPKHKLNLIPFEDDHRGILNEIENLGEKFDFLIGVCDSKEWLSRCLFLPLGEYKKMVAVSRTHPLSKKKFIEISDLYGKTLMMVERGDSGINDFLRNDLERNHPEIRIEDTPHFYDLSVFNRCAQTGNVLLTIECWSDVHPELVTIPINWGYTIPYGLLYSSNAGKDVIKFVDEVKNITKDTMSSLRWGGG